VMLIVPPWSLTDADDPRLAGDPVPCRSMPGFSALV
jgi:hypothetical protein